MNTKSEIELIERFVDGIVTDDELPRLQQLLRESGEARALLRSLATVDFGLQDLASSDLGPTGNTVEEPTRAVAGPAKALLALAAALIGVLGVGIYLQRSGQPNAVALAEHSDVKIVTISGLGGPLSWTGDGGRVSRSLSVGMSLPGGTVEGLSPDSWIELEFADGSTLTLSGTSRLVFSDFGQKELHLKQGNLRGNVRAQVAGKPMLVHTRSAKLEIVGTQFDVEASVASTALSVNEGRVKLTRLSDGSSVEVPANHRVVAAIQSQLVPETIPEFVHHWKSQLHLGPQGTAGEWSPQTDTQAAHLKTLASVYTTPLGENVSVHSVGVQASSSASSSVVLTRESKLRFRGRVAAKCDVVFGMVVRDQDGGFGGNFNAVATPEDLGVGEDFEYVIPADQFELNIHLTHLQDQLLQSPIGVVVDHFWCATLEPAGLEIFEVELITPQADSH